MGKTEQGLTRNKIFSELIRSPHGDLQQYLPVASEAVRTQAEFFAHLISHNEIHGQIRDAKVALPVISLKDATFNGELLENSLAHLAKLDPRNLVRAVRFAKDIGIQGRGGTMKRLVASYLRAREAHPGWWIRATLRHRQSLKTLYALHHIKAAPEVREVVMEGKRPKGSVFEALVQLPGLEAGRIAGLIAKHRIPFPVAAGALGARAKEEAVVLALIDIMTPTELVTNTKLLERLGVKTVPALRAAYEEGLGRAVVDKRVGLKAQRAAEAQTDKGLQKKLKATQEQSLGQVEGDWLVLGDRSGSMADCIEIARQVAGLLARMASGQVHLIFFDTSPQAYDVTGKSYDEILQLTQLVGAGGRTSIGCGLQYILDKDIEVDGIAIVTDEGENESPRFAKTYGQYAERFGKQVPVYCYSVGNEQVVYRGQLYQVHRVLREQMEKEGHDMQLFELGANVDYNSLPNLVQTMRTQRYGLIDDIMNTPLLTVEQALTRKEAA